MRRWFQRLIVLGCVVASIVVAQAATQSLLFDQPATFAVGSGPAALTVGDFNHDGRPDIAVANSNSVSVSILLGNGAGWFGAARLIPVSSIPYGINSGDFNGDGNPDLVVVGNLGLVAVLLGDGAGGFGEIDYRLTNALFAVAVADFNLDGHLDLAVTGSDNGNIQILLGDGVGGFVTGKTFGPQQAFMLTVADFNRDGRPDIAAPDIQTNTVKILLGDGTGDFSVRSRSTGGVVPIGVLAADFNRDGSPDLALMHQSSSSTITVLLGDGTGNFGDPLSIPVARSGYIASADFDGDGNADLAYSTSGATATSIYLGDGAGHFTPPRDISGGGLGLMVADFDRNGHPDLAALQGTSAGSVVVMINQTIDTDGDTVLDRFDNCRTVANPDQSDIDHDNVGDACDNCLPLPNQDQVDRNGNGIGDVCDSMIALVAGSGGIANLQASLDSLTARVAALESAKNTTDADIATLKRQVAELQVKVAFLLSNQPPGRPKPTQLP